MPVGDVILASVLCSGQWSPKFSLLSAWEEVLQKARLEESQHGLTEHLGGNDEHKGLWMRWLFLNTEFPGKTTAPSFTISVDVKARDP